MFRKIITLLLCLSLTFSTIACSSGPSTQVRQASSSKPVFTASVKSLKDKLASVKPFLKVGNVNFEIQDFGVTVLDRRNQVLHL